MVPRPPAEALAQAGALPVGLRMTQEEIRIRSAYLFLACSQALEQCKDRLLSHNASGTPSVKMLLERTLRRELGLLFRYWTTRLIWDRLDANEMDAKHLNIVLLRLFTEAFKLPQDGSGLRYAELSTVGDEIHELSHRVANALSQQMPRLASELQGVIPPWRDAVTKYTLDALELPLDRLAASVKDWAVETPGQEQGRSD